MSHIEAKIGVCWTFWAVACKKVYLLRTRNTMCTRCEPYAVHTFKCNIPWTIIREHISVTPDQCSVHTQWAQYVPHSWSTFPVQEIRCRSTSIAQPLCGVSSSLQGPTQQHGGYSTVCMHMYGNNVINTHVHMYVCTVYIYIYCVHVHTCMYCTYKLCICSCTALVLCTSSLQSTGWWDYIDREL